MLSPPVTSLQVLCPSITIPDEKLSIDFYIIYTDFNPLIWTLIYSAFGHPPKDPK